MRKSLLFVMVALLTTVTTLTIQAQAHKSLPQNAKDYISKHFKDYTINHYEKDRDIIDIEHTVYISNTKNTYKLEFNEKGVVQKIESKNRNSNLPKSVLPVKITEYVNKHFPNTQIVEWSRDNNKQVVELDNELELVFNSKGNFVRIDD